MADWSYSGAYAWSVINTSFKEDSNSKKIDLGFLRNHKSASKYVTLWTSGFASKTNLGAKGVNVQQYSLRVLSFLTLINSSVSSSLSFKSLTLDKLRFFKTMKTSNASVASSSVQVPEQVVDKSSSGEKKKKKKDV